jgi:hypothetical protein
METKEKYGFCGNVMPCGTPFGNCIQVEGKCIRCEVADAKHVSGWDGNTNVGYGWCDACMKVVNAEDAAGLAAGRHPFGY